MNEATAELPIYQTISRGYRAFLTLVVMLGAFMAILDTTVVNVVVPKMMGPLATDLYGIQWVITAYMTAAAVGLLLTTAFPRCWASKNSSSSDWRCSPPPAPCAAWPARSPP